MLNGDIEGRIGDIDRVQRRVYDDNLNCTWIITSSNGLSVKIKIETLDITLCDETATCGTDYIQVITGPYQGFLGSRGDGPFMLRELGSILYI